jgi:hypothetical protein
MTLARTQRRPGLAKLKTPAGNGAEGGFRASRDEAQSVCPGDFSRNSRRSQAPVPGATETFKELLGSVAIRKLVHWSFRYTASIGSLFTGRYKTLQAQGRAVTAGALDVAHLKYEPVLSRIDRPHQDAVQDLVVAL